MLLATCCALAGCPGQLDRDASIPDWSFKGKLGYRTPSGSGSVRIDWRQFPKERFDIVLRAALGLGVARVEGSADGPVTLVQRGERVEFADPSTAAAEALGVAVPLAALRHWVRGEAAPAPHVATEGGLSQAGWEVQFTRRPDGLPSRVVMRRGDVRFVLAVRDWL